MFAQNWVWQDIPMNFYRTFVPAAVVGAIFADNCDIEHSLELNIIYLSTIENVCIA